MITELSQQNVLMSQFNVDALYIAAFTYPMPKIQK